MQVKYKCVLNLNKIPLAHYIFDELMVKVKNLKFKINNVNSLTRFPEQPPQLKFIILVGTYSIAAD